MFGQVMLWRGGLSIGYLFEVLLVVFLGLLFYGVLCVAYRALLHARGVEYDRKSVVHLIILLPLALLLANITESLFFNRLTTQKGEVKRRELSMHEMAVVSGAVGPVGAAIGAVSAASMYVGYENS